MVFLLQDQSNGTGRTQVTVVVPEARCLSLHVGHHIRLQIVSIKAGKPSTRWARVTYICALLVVVFLLSFLVLVALGPLLPNGEVWAGFAFWWVGAWPMFVLLGATSIVIYPTYRRASSWARVFMVFLGNAMIVMLLGQGLTVGLTLLFPAYGRWLLSWLE
jgi:hypothetical protein